MCALLSSGCGEGDSAFKTNTCQVPAGTPLTGDSELCHIYAINPETHD
jgi:hypothetical protein